MIIDHSLFTIKPPAQPELNLGYKPNVFVKPNLGAARAKELAHFAESRQDKTKSNDQSKARFSFGMARKRRMKSN